MEFSALIGFFTGVALLIWAVLAGGTMEMFWDPASLRIVLGGTLAAVAVSHKGAHLRRLPGLFLQAFRRSSLQSPEQLSDLLVDLAYRARREGLLSLEEAVDRIEDPFTRDAVQMLADATPAEQMEVLLNNEIENRSEYNRRGSAVFRTAGSVSPAFGMIGTLIGLIIMLVDLDNPDAIGSGMAVALITTLYGTLFANVVFNPIANKLAERDEEERYLRIMIREGVLSIQEGLNPRFIKTKLDAYVQPTPVGRPSDEIADPIESLEGGRMASDD